MVLHLNEIRINSLRVQTQRHKSIDRSSFRDKLESPRLLVLELDDFVVAADDLVAFVLGTGEYKLIQHTDFHDQQTPQLCRKPS
jgi:hypothetical protein